MARARAPSRAPLRGSLRSALSGLPLAAQIPNPNDTQHESWLVSNCDLAQKARVNASAASDVRTGRYLRVVLHVNDVNEREARYIVRRVLLPARGLESFAVIGPDRRPVELIDEYLAWLTDRERSPNTVEAYAHDLRAFWIVLAERGLSWEQVGVTELGEFAAWARRPAENVVVLVDEAAVAVDVVA